MGRCFGFNYNPGMGKILEIKYFILLLRKEIIDKNSSQELFSFSNSERKIKLLDVALRIVILC